MTVLIDGLLVTRHTVNVPLDWRQPDSRTLAIGVREVVVAERASEALPALLYLRGGPGMHVPAPLAHDGWLKELLRSHRVFLMDQRGTGISTPVDTVTARSMAPAELARYLEHFRADSIVRDAEHVRKELAGDEKWVVHGQSFGGFCALTYLSLAPEGLAGVIITGGFAPVLRTADDVYRSLRDLVIERNEKYYAQFPEDRQAVQRVLSHLNDNTVDVHPGWRLTAKQFLVRGATFGFKEGPERTHEIIERCVVDLDTLGTLSQWTLVNTADPLGIVTNPIYAALHEPIYCSPTPSNWAAQRAIQEDSRFAENDPAPFSGEMIFPWMFEEIPALQPFAEAADILAAKDDWTELYDIERLRSNDVPVVGTIYYDDLYVFRDYAIETANLVGNAHPWITNEFEHSGYHDDPKRVMGRLFETLQDVRSRPV
jgi:pimeloyl-ACP methyl ester carboxylesterase